MRVKIVFSLILFFAIFSSSVLYTQNKIKTKGKQTNTKSDKSSDKQPVNKFPKEIINQVSDKDNAPDYKVISSNASYVEIEFYPWFYQKQKIEYNGNTFSVLNFKGAESKEMDEPGQPDLRWRSFPLIFPSENNNTISVIDYDVVDAANINLAPIPGYRFIDPKRRDFENIVSEYIKDSKVYSQNKSLPENIAIIDQPHQVRDLTAGSVRIYPFQYNPVTGALKQYTRIRVRITFGQAPIKLNKPRSKAETELLNGIGINSDIGMSWMSPKVLNSNRDVTITNSVLSSGDWYKIEIKDNESGGSEGIYKLTKSFLEGSGMSLSGVDPRTIKIYGNGGNYLPEDLLSPRPQDLQELAVYAEGENDGTFDANDYILFYGRSINSWKYNTASNVYDHYVNFYSASNYYWICIRTSGNGRRMAVQNSENVSNPLVPSSFTEKLFYEPEKNNLLDEGTLWLSENKKSGGVFTWNNTLTGLESNSSIFYRIKPASRCPDGNTNNMLLKEDNSTVSEVNFPMGTVGSGFGDWIWTATTAFYINQSQKTNGEQSSFKATYYASTNDADGYIDWMEIQYKRRLNSATNDYIHFDSPNQTGTVQYNVSPFSNNSIKIFDATRHDTVKIIQPLSSSSNGVSFERNETQGILSNYLVTGPGGYKTPTGISQKIPNQNIKGSYISGASFIIITPSNFLAAANRLKSKREAGGPGNPNYLKTEIFTVDQIYNEFSGGVLDAVALRDFIKYAYENWQEKPAFVCLFGDGDFDYKNIFGTGNNYVPPFEHSDPNINQVAGFTSDDFFVDVVNDPFQVPDLSVGRICARSLDNANQYLDKIDCYEDPHSNGYWKNRMIFCADDGYTGGIDEGDVHTAQCEELAENTTGQYTPQTIDKTKIYLVLYPPVITSQGRRKPAVNADIIKYWNEGSIDIHYTGHGSPEVWAHEYVLEKDVVLSQLNNTCKYPFVTIASCDMAKFDNPLSQSAAELFAMTPLKGSIGTLAASRPVYGSENQRLMKFVFNQLYAHRDTLLLQKRFGEAIFLAKQPVYGLNEKKFILICDPTARVQIPRFESRVDSISGLSNDTMRALSKIKIYGSIINPDSSLWSNYNGKIFLKIFDVTRQISIFDENGLPFNFKLAGGIIYSGTQTISNGKWSIEYIVPKDISYLNQNGKLINYFYNDQADGSSLYTNFIVGGINPNAAVDTTGPKISLFLNNRNFRSGDIVNQNFKLIGDFFDESGINTTGTIGHKIEATLDNNLNNKFDLTTFYNSDSSYKSGSLEFGFSSISIGRHNMKVTVWDTYNNASEGSIDFDVSSSSSLQVTNVYNFPNPFRNNTSFTFQHNYPNPINVKIKVYTVAGRLIKEIDHDNISDKFVSIDWNGKDEDGETLSNGVYIYKLIVTSDQSNVTSVGKLAVLK